MQRVATSPEVLVPTRSVGTPGSDAPRREVLRGRVGAPRAGPRSGRALGGPAERVHQETPRGFAPDPPWTLCSRRWVVYYEFSGLAVLSGPIRSLTTLGKGGHDAGR